MECTILRTDRSRYQCRTHPSSRRPGPDAGTERIGEARLFCDLIPTRLGGILKADDTNGAWSGLPTNVEWFNGGKPRGVLAIGGVYGGSWVWWGRAPGKPGGVTFRTLGYPWVGRQGGLFGKFTALVRCALGRVRRATGLKS